jgi:hypothetical protein
MENDMLNVQNSEVKLVKLTPRIADKDGSCATGADIRLVFRIAEKANDVLAALSLPTLSRAFWDGNGAPVIDGAQVKARARIRNCTVKLWPTGQEKSVVEATGDLSGAKISALPGSAIELDVKLRADLPAKAFADLFELMLCDYRVEVGSALKGAVVENQFDLHTAATGE